MEKFVASLLDKTEYAIHMRNFEKTLNLESELKKSAQNCLKSYIDINKDLAKKQKVTEKKKELFSIRTKVLLN